MFQCSKKYTKHADRIGNWGHQKLSLTRSVLGKDLNTPKNVPTHAGFPPVPPKSLDFFQRMDESTPSLPREVAQQLSLTHPRGDVQPIYHITQYLIETASFGEGVKSRENKTKGQEVSTRARFAPTYGHIENHVHHTHSQNVPKYFFGGRQIINGLPRLYKRSVLAGPSSEDPNYGAIFFAPRLHGVCAPSLSTY